MEFDRFANEYEEILNGSVGSSGENALYFAEYKALYLRSILGPSFDGKSLGFGCLAVEYDMAVIANVMHHIHPAQRQQAVRNVLSHLRPGGLLAIFEHNSANPVTKWVVEHRPFDDDAILLPLCETCSYVETAGAGSLHRDDVVFMLRSLSALRGIEDYSGRLPLGAQYVMAGPQVE